MQADYTLREAAGALGVALETLRTKAKRGQIATIVVERHGKPQTGISAETFLLLRQVPGTDEYQKAQAAFLAEMRIIGLKGTPCDDRHIKNLVNYLDLFWRKLGGTPSIERLTAQNLKLVYAHYVPDRAQKKYYDATRIHLYKAVSSMVAYLVGQGRLNATVLFDIRQAKPHRKARPLRLMPELSEIHAALDYNTQWSAYRTEYDVALTNTLIALYAFAGLRKSEAAALESDCLILDGQALHVYGKGCKERVVPVAPVLAKYLAQWQAIRPKSPWFVPAKDGSQLTKWAIADKFARLKHHAENDANTNVVIYSPHPYRRAYVTFLRQAGVPAWVAQHSAGHSTSAMNDAYDQTSIKHMIAAIKNTPHLFNAMAAEPMPTPPVPAGAPPPESPKPAKRRVYGRYS